jgi:type III restriction enzyme
MAEFEVPEPIICSPCDEPAFHWHLQPGAEPEKRPKRRPAHYFYRAPGEGGDEHDYAGIAVELPLVNLVRERLRQWRGDAAIRARRERPLK